MAVILGILFVRHMQQVRNAHKNFDRKFEENRSLARPSTKRSTKVYVKRAVIG
jgi:hypothetical protein